MAKKHTQKSKDETHKKFVQIPADKFAADLIEKRGSRNGEFLDAFKASRRSFFSERKLAAAD